VEVAAPTTCVSPMACSTSAWSTASTRLEVHLWVVRKGPDLPITSVFFSFSRVVAGRCVFKNKSVLAYAMQLGVTRVLCAHILHLHAPTPVLREKFSVTTSHMSSGFYGAILLLGRGTCAHTAIGSVYLGWFPRRYRTDRVAPHVSLWLDVQQGFAVEFFFVLRDCRCVPVQFI
jgi:hypothetical protein